MLEQFTCIQYFYQRYLHQEAGIKTDEGRKEPFTELNFILDCLKQRNLEPALEWAKKHREALLAQVGISCSCARSLSCINVMP